MGWRTLLLGALLAVPARGDDLPPLVLPAAADLPDLPAGTPVSRPLRPAATAVETCGRPPAEPAPTPTATLLDPAEADRPLGHSWHALELLVWWPRAAPLPPLAVAGTSTQALIGGRAIGTDAVGGGRFTVGFAVDPEQTAGLTVTYLFLGTATQTATAGDLLVPPPRPLGRPVVRADTGRAAVVPVAGPGQGGTLTATTSSRVSGWEVGGVASLVAGPRGRITAVAGYRYFQVNEGLRVEQVSLLAGGGPPVLVAAADQFDAHSRFHGGQFGLLADLTQGAVFVEAAGKVALGQGVTVVRASGQAVAVRPGPAVEYVPAGVLGQPSNSSRLARSGFAVLPEAAVKVGYRLADHSRVSVGYTFLYLSEAVRPGRQVDLTLDPDALPVAGRGGAGGTGDRPALGIARDDFWVQGLTFGLEYRY